MTNNRADVTLTRAIDVASVSEGGADHAIEANEEERRVVAARLGVPELRRLKGEFHVEPIAGGVEVKFRLDASAERQCVISLEPMTEEIREDHVIRFERSFRETDDEPEDDIAREPLEGASIDLGEILVQHLSLSLDPHPKKPGAKSLLSDYRDAASPSPFTVLKGLVDDER